MKAIDEVTLNPQQERVVENDAQWLIINGSAGTGKSLALCRRALKYLQAGETVLFITGTTKMLNEYTGMLTNNKFADFINENKCVFERKDMFYLKHGLRGDYNKSGNSESDENEVKEISDYTEEDVRRSNNFNLDEFIEKYEMDHVLIDEVQDFYMHELYLFAKLAKKSFTVVASNAQDIFKRKNGLWEEKKKKLEEILGKHFEECNMEIQCRMSAEILALANDIRERLEVITNTDQKPENRGLPRIIMCNNEDEEIEKLKEIVTSIDLEHRRVGVVIGYGKGKRNEKFVNDLLTECGITVYEKENPLVKTGIWVINVGDAKGIEFDDVILFLDNDTFFCDCYPGGKGEGARSLYVAITRACSTVTMIADVSHNRSGYIGNEYNGNIPVFKDGHYKKIS